MCFEAGSLTGTWASLFKLHWPAGELWETPVFASHNWGC